MLTDTEGKTWHKVTEGFVSGVLWSPDGKKLLFSKKDPSTQNYQLWYYDLYSGEIKNLGLNTMPEKAVWGFDNQTIYAAVPKSIGAALGNSFSLDMFYKLNIQTSEKKSYDAGSMELDGRDLFLSQDNNKLFFRSAQDGGLYYLDLSQ
jgi:Tol biopolymer transport system component